jgi:hypothetical protein
MDRSSTSLSFLEMVTRDKFLPVAKDNIYDTNRIFKIMKLRIKDASGTSFSWNTVAHRHRSVSRFKGFSTIPIQGNNPLEGMNLPVGQYAAALSFAKDDLIKNTGNKEKLADMAEAQMKNAEATLIEDIGLDMYGDGSLVNGLQGIVGLQAAISASNTYAGFDRSSAANAFWRSNVDATAYTQAQLETPTETGYLPRLMLKQFTAATHSSSPDFLVSTENVYNTYSLIGQVSNLRFGMGKADLGFSTLEFNGATFLFDKYCPTSSMFFLNTKDWDVYVYPGANFDLDKDEETGSIWIRALGQIAKTAYVLWMGQVRCNEPRAQASLTGLAS